jgi:phage-related protein
VREIEFYRTKSGNCPIEDFLDTLSDKQFEKVGWVLRLIKEIEHIPKEYYKKLKNTDDIWEIRIQFGSNIFRLLCFNFGNKVVVLTNGFAKKTQKVPRQEIVLAEKRKRDYFNRRK